MEIKPENRTLEGIDGLSSLSNQHLSGRLSLTEKEIFLGPQVRALLVDFDGTTVQTLDAHTRSLMAVFSELACCNIPHALIERVFKEPRHSEGPPPSEGEVLKILLSDTFRHLGMRALSSIEPTQLVTMRNQFIKDHVQELDIAPVEGIQEVLLRANELGLRIVLCTNSSLDFVEPILDRFSLAPLIHRIIASDSLPGIRPKPAPDIYLAALEGLNLKSSESVVLEDSPTGVMAASRAYVPAIVRPAPHLIESTCQKLLAGSATDNVTIVGSWNQIRFQDAVK